MAAVSAIRAGLKSRLETISTFLATYAVAPGQPIVPCAMVLPRAIDYDTSMGRGSDSLSFDVLVLLGIPTTALSQEHLDPYLDGSGATSVKAAIEADETLGGVADRTHVTGVSQYGDIEYAGTLYLGARFAVEVDVDGTA